MAQKMIRLIPMVDHMPLELPRDFNWEKMNSHVAEIIKGSSGPKAELYIDAKDSFKDIWDQLDTMYKQSHTNEEQGRSTTQSGKRRDKNYTRCGSFYDAILNGNWEEVEDFLKIRPLALTAKITADGNTALHVAVKAKKLTIVGKLLEKLETDKKQIEALKRQNKEGKTALYIAASRGFTAIARELVDKDKNSLLIECDNETIPLLPLFVAAKYDNKEIVNYLYHETKKYSREFYFKYAYKNDEKARLWLRQCASFLAHLIYNDDYDLASEIINDYPSLALTRSTDVETPLFALAQRPSLGANTTVGDKASKFQLRNKLDFESASKAPKLLLEQIILTIDDWKSQKSALSAALFKAAEVGSVEFVDMIINSLPLVVSWLNDDYQNIFHVAIIHRQ
ncbi:uncharacterized protein LOC122659090 [Telopea speciosissima]|uniref:uncharacterized protein LOC122659090 n=1 Tax=Telopea speciosissima TaxID=54955 RepID=UPI001CC4D094|nr:uncharacterized protein LOC122659090 [Telopea speciosissima]